MSETLHTCPACGRGNFTTRGLRAHVCRPLKTPSQTMPKPVLSPAVVSSKPIDLDKVDPSQISHSGKFDAEQLGQRAKAMIEYVDALKKERAQKAILAGLFLHQVKLSLGFGAFGAWKQRHFARSSSSIGRYMDLAAKFSRSMKLNLPELIGSNQLSLDLTTTDADGAALKAKLEKFVGEAGLTDLMHRHGVIKQGGAREKKPDAPLPAPTPADEQEAARQASAQAFQNIFDAIDALEKSGLDEIHWNELTPELAETLDGKLRAVTGRFHERLLRLRHELSAE